MSGLQILIIDFGASNDHLIARNVRDMGVYCEVQPNTIPADNVKAIAAKGIIFSGLPAGADLNGLPFDKGILALGLPYLVIQNTSDTQLKDFLFSTCGCTADWSMKNYVAKAVEDIRVQVGSGRVVLGLSGGVDSSVCAALISRAIGNQLTCIFVDHGLMRKNEPDEVEGAFKASFDLNFIRLDAADRFLGKLAGIEDPERKRKIIGEEFIRVFEETAKSLGPIDYLAQGTIYPDIIESGTAGGKVVKSHHNVGGLPETIGFKGLVEPLKYLFKDEVRALGAELGLPDKLVHRQPFPGPGLGVRVIGEITKAKLDTLRDADAIFREELAAAGLERSIGQCFAVLTSMRSVGVRSDARTYDYTLALRAVNTIDFMSAGVVRIPYEVLEKVVARITSEVAGISRVVYDITPKPPATIEWE